MISRSETDPIATRASHVVETCIANQVRRTNRVVTRLYNDLLRPVGITIAEMNLLVVIASRDGIRAVQLAKGLDMEKSTVSRNLKRLETHGWVTVRDDPEARGSLVELTASGTDVLERAIPAWEEAQSRARTLVVELSPGWQ